MKTSVGPNWQDVDTNNFSNCVISNNEKNTYNIEKHIYLSIMSIKNSYSKKEIKFPYSRKQILAQRMIYLSVDTTPIHNSLLVHCCI